MTRAAFFCNGDSLRTVYGKGRRERVAAVTELYEHVISSDSFAAHRQDLASVEVIFSTWGMPVLEAAELDAMPALRAVFYAAGSVKGFARPLLERGITVVSAWSANAVPVAEFTLAQMLLACKGYFRNTRDCRVPQRRAAGQVFRGQGVFGESVGLIGVGMVGARVCQLLRPFQLRILAFDPYLSAPRARELNVEKVALAELFARAYVVSNHLPDIPATRGMLTGDLFASMRGDATFINTGRGAQVIEEEMCAVLERRPDLTALLDVTFPEPPEPGSPLYRLPNVQLSSHIAGSMNDEVVRMADFVLDEFARWRQGAPLHYAVTREMLDTMA